MKQLFNALRTSRALRNAAIMALDAIAAGASLVAALNLRMNADIPQHMLDGLVGALPITVLIAVATFHISGLYSRVWRLVSLGDLALMVEAATIAIVLSVLTLFLLGQSDWIPTSVPIIQWFILVVMLGGIRAGRRMAGLYIAQRFGALPQPAAEQGALRTALIVGVPESAEMVLRQIEASASALYRAVGIIDPTGDHVRLRVRGVPILGTVDGLEQIVNKLAASGRRPECVIIAEGDSKLAGSQVVNLVTQAETLGLSVARTAPMATIDTSKPAELEIRPINFADLLERPQSQVDPLIVAEAVAGRRVLVTGAGGTIGRELVRQIAAAGPSELQLLDAGEYNLYAVDMDLQENYPDVPRTPILCSIRQREAVMKTFETHRPELVFHAAALKHVPLVEQNICSGVQTNVLGTRNVADAAKRYNVRAMIQVSTDKAVNPVGMMGASKRLGELYCQALDLEGQGMPDAPRFMTVRFGNVLGSSGSLIPLLQRQLNRRGPLTVTHPEIRRYFMTVFEAVQLILQSTARGLDGDVRRGRIFVLDMGEPIRIIDIARRMIRLAGLEPDRDVPIQIVGLRPGEKLYEELFDANEEQLPSAVPGMFEAEPNPMSLTHLNRVFDELDVAIKDGDGERARTMVMDLLDEQSKRPARSVEPHEAGVARPVRTPQIASPVGPATQAA